MAISEASAARMVNAELGITAHVAPTTPIKGRLYTVAGSGTAAGTEVTGGSYAAQNATFAAQSGTTPATTSAAMNFTGMPAATVVELGFTDSGGTPRYLGHSGSLTGGNKTTNSGDTLSFASGQATFGVTPG